MRTTSKRLAAIVALCASTLAGCGGGTSNKCQENAGYCRANSPDGGCVLYMPVCCSGGGPICGEGQTLIDQKIEGCHEYNSACGVVCI